MKSFNKRKFWYVGLLITACSVTFLTFQNFTQRRLASVSLEGKTKDASKDSISAALQAAETDREAKQMALNDEEVRLKKMKAEKKDRKPNSVLIDSDINNEMDSSRKETDDSTF